MVILFLIASPIALLFALDYSYDWQGKKFVQNGAFYFKSEPKNTTIYTDGKNKKTTPRLIKRLSPHNYTIEIAKKDYQSWKKELRIEPGLVTEEKNILLIRNKPELEFVTESKSLPEFSIPRLSDHVKKLLDSLTLKPNTYKIITSLSRYTGLIEYAPNQSPAATQTGTLNILDSDNAVNLVAKDVVSAEFSSDGKKLLWFTPHEIWVYWLEDEYVQPYRKVGDKKFITRFSESISQATWYEGDNQHIIFTVEDAIKITEISDRGSKNINDITTISNPQIISKDKFLYILSENKLYKTKIGDDSLF